MSKTEKLMAFANTSAGLLILAVILVLIAAALFPASAPVIFGGAFGIIGAVILLHYATHYKWSA